MHTFYTHTQSQLALCTEFHFFRMKRNICRSFPLLILGLIGLWWADSLVWYRLEGRNSLRSGFAPCPQQQTINIAVLDVFYYQAHKMSIINQGSYLYKCLILR